MTLYLYWKSHQENLYAALKPLLPEAKRLDLIGDSEVTEPYRVCIVLSQMTEIEAFQFKKFEWHAVFVYAGVRLQGEQVTSFKTAEEAAEAVQRYFSEVLEREKGLYLDQLTAGYDQMDKEAREYLEKITQKELGAPGKIEFWPWNRFKPLKRRTRNFPDGLMVSVGSAAFSATLAKTLSQYGKGNVLLIDGNLLSPSMDDHFKIRQLQTHVKSHLKGIDNTGLNIVLDSVGKHAALGPILKKAVHRVNKRLDVMLGNYNFYNYEHYSDSQFSVLLEALQTHYNLIIFHGSPFPYDSFTMTACKMSKMNLFASTGERENIRYLYHLLEVLNVKQNIPSERLCVVSDERDNKRRLYTRSAMKMLFGDRYLGTIHRTDQSAYSFLKRLERSVEHGRG
jgi:MinD-like ATPase involved in chromosome partitioning or flagellar assembly